MKKIVLLIFALLTFSVTHLRAQFLIGSGGLTIKGGSKFSASGFTMQPINTMQIYDNELFIKDTVIAGLPNSSIQKLIQWNTPILLTGEFGIRYSDSQLNGNIAEFLKIAYSPDLSSPVFTNNSASIADTNYVYATFSGVNIQRITAVQDGSILPLTFISFSVQKVGTQKAQISWETVEEINVSHYIIQRSIDGIHFYDIGKVTANNLKELQKYQYMDSSPELGDVNYYRIQSVDIDATLSYTKIQSILFEAFSSYFELFPNPTADILYMRNIPQHSEIRMLDVNGKIVRQENNFENEISWDIAKFDSGMYLIQIIDKSELVKVAKIIIAK